MPPTNSRPNLLLIFADQHRYDFLRSAGASFLRTPNLDRLAARGVRFTQCTTNSPVCAPARIALAAGMQPVHLGSLHNNSYLPLSAPTYYQRLRDAGYRVGCVGKLDLAKPDPYNGRHGDRPVAFGWGFTHPVECEGKMHAGSGRPPKGPYTYWLAEQGLLDVFCDDYQRRARDGWVRCCEDSPLPTEAFEDVYIGRRAAEWIDNIPDDFPWHLFVSFVGPHDPFDPPTEYAERYRDADMPPAIADSMDGKPDFIASRHRITEGDFVARTRRQYCALVELIDDQVGRILDALERRGMLDNTHIVFSSDHGEMLGDHGLYTKCFAYEASLRVPLLAAGPGIEGGRVCDEPVELIDINPTLCELAGLAPQANIDARSFAGVLAGRTDRHRDETVSMLASFRCIRTRRHKFIGHVSGPTEVYDLQEDPDELHNIAADRPDLRQQLAARLSERLLERQWRR